MADMAKPDDVEAAGSSSSSLGIEQHRSGDLHELGRQPEGLLRPQWRHRLHLVERRAVSTTGRSSGASGSLLPGRAPRPQHRRQEGHPARQMVVWDPFQPLGGNTPEAAPERHRHPLERLLLGSRAVHASSKSTRPARTSRTCRSSFTLSAASEVVEAADFDGSTEYIIDTITSAPAGSTWAVGTEINLVNRLQQEMPDKHDLLPRSGDLPLLHDVQGASCVCALDAGASRGRGGCEPIVVDPVTRSDALIALDRMLSVP